MEFVILMGSPRKHGNTISLVKPFMEELNENGHNVTLFWLYDRQIKGCLACRNCQKDWSKFGCIHNDDLQEIFDAILSADVIVFATPVYSWSCTAPMKATLDRLVYGMNKYYGEEKGPSLWKGKHVALISTCGYPPEKGTDLLEESIKRYCKHSQLIYDGMLAEHDLGYNAKFMDDEKTQRAKAFAHRTLTDLVQKALFIKKSTNI
ncbi:multimeric flavodoxin WrbA [Clostridiales Family XIII bacterium PM5-7]